MYIDPAVAGICETNKAFMSMFLGFIDGDGYIDVGEQTQQNKKTKLKTRSTIRLAMGIALDARDLYVLKYFVRVPAWHPVRGPRPGLGEKRLTKLFYIEMFLLKIELTHLNKAAQAIYAARPSLPYG